MASGFVVAAIATVFLVEAPVLEGLVRTASFVVPGLPLATLAWLSRRTERGPSDGGMATLGALPEVPQYRVATERLLFHAGPV